MGVNDAESSAETTAQGSGRADETLSLATRVGDALRQRGWTVATAESCTGGLVGAALTSVAGSSAYYAGGAVAYANRAKQNFLAVAESTLLARGAVSEATAAEMAEGARENLEVDVAVSVTGIAGPGGGTAEKPVGRVYVAIAAPATTRVLRFDFPGDRAEVRESATIAALEAILAEAENKVRDAD